MIKGLSQKKKYCFVLILEGVSELATVVSAYRSVEPGWFMSGSFLSHRMQAADILVCHCASSKVQIATITAAASTLHTPHKHFAIAPRALGLELKTAPFI